MGIGDRAVTNVRRGLIRFYSARERRPRLGGAGRTGPSAAQRPDSRKSNRCRFATRADATAAIAAWIRRYDNVRLHSTFGYVPPIEWELRYRLTQQ